MGYGESAIKGGETSTVEYLHIVLADATSRVSNCKNVKISKGNWKCLLEWIVNIS